MSKTYTITQEQLDKVLKNLSNVRTIMTYDEKEGNEADHQKWLSEYCGIIGVLCNLGLLAEWDKFLAAEIRAEMEAEEARR